MNDNTTKLIEKLAQQLGTTTEFLWSILVKQAPISATINLGICLLIVIFWIAAFKVHKYFATAKEDDKWSYYELEGILYAPMIIVGAVSAVLVFVFISMLKMAFIGYFNPEYWALNYILDRL